MVDLQDGSREELQFRARPTARPGDLSWMRRVIGPDGGVREVWHEVADAFGRIIHAHRYK